MKSFFLISLLTCLAVYLRAQTPKTVVNCWIQSSRVNYGKLAQLLPDSITSTLLIDVHKKLNTSDVNLILLWLEQQGWKLIGADPAAGSLILAKEIDLDDAARTLFLQKLENLHKK
jgi:uncharacterized membrane protein